jgi:hypothetical protein
MMPLGILTLDYYAECRLVASALSAVIKSIMLNVVMLTPYYIRTSA